MNAGRLVAPLISMLFLGICTPLAAQIRELNQLTGGGNPLAQRAGGSEEELPGTFSGNERQLVEKNIIGSRNTARRESDPYEGAALPPGTGGSLDNSGSIFCPSGNCNCDGDTCSVPTSSSDPAFSDGRSYRVNPKSAVGLAAEETGSTTAPASTLRTKRSSYFAGLTLVEPAIAAATDIAMRQATEAIDTEHKADEALRVSLLQTPEIGEFLVQMWEACRQRALLGNNGQRNSKGFLDAARECRAKFKPGDLPDHPNEIWKDISAGMGSLFGTGQDQFITIVRKTGNGQRPFDENRIGILDIVFNLPIAGFISERSKELLANTLRRPRFIVIPGVIPLPVPVPSDDALSATNSSQSARLARVLTALKSDFLTNFGDFLIEVLPATKEEASAQESVAPLRVYFARRNPAITPRQVLAVRNEELLKEIYGTMFGRCEAIRTGNFQGRSNAQACVLDGTVDRGFNPFFCEAAEVRRRDLSLFSDEDYAKLSARGFTFDKTHADILFEIFMRSGNPRGCAALSEDAVGALLSELKSTNNNRQNRDVLGEVERAYVFVAQKLASLQLIGSYQEAEGLISTLATSGATGGAASRHAAQLIYQVAGSNNLAGLYQTHLEDLNRFFKRYGEVIDREEGLRSRALVGTGWQKSGSNSGTNMGMGAIGGGGAR